jgi:hypothetical protein
MQNTRILVAIVFALAALVGCATTTHTDLRDVVKKKAAYELRCEELTLTELSNGQAMSNGFAATDQKSYGVDGCGQRASYQVWCTNMLGKESCDAVSTTAMTNPR